MGSCIACVIILAVLVGVRCVTPAPLVAVPLTAPSAAPSDLSFSSMPRQLYAFAVPISACSRLSNSVALMSISGVWNGFFMTASASARQHDSTTPTAARLPAPLVTPSRNTAQAMVIIPPSALASSLSGVWAQLTYLVYSAHELIEPRSPYRV